MDFLNDSILALLGRQDFIGGIDNEALDFSQLESFIHVTNGPPSTSSVVVVGGTESPVDGTQTHLPDSPPDSGSEPPYSPDDLHGFTTLTGTTTAPHDLPPSAQHHHHHHHHHNHHHGGVLSTGNDLHGPELGNLPVTSVPVVTGGPSQPTSSNGAAGVVMELRGVVTPMQIPHNLLSNHNVLYLRPETETGTTGSVCKTDVPSATEQQHLLHQQSPPLLNMGTPQSSYGGDMPTSPNLLASSVQQQSTTINADDMNRLLPNITDVYLNQSSMKVANTRKRKLSQPDVCNSSPIVKSEPSAALSPMCPSYVEPSSPTSTTGGSGSGTGSASGNGTKTGTVSGTGGSSPTSSVLLGTGSQTSDNVPEMSGHNSESGDSCPLQCIRFSAFQQQNWHVLCDQSLQELPMPHYRVDADKGFNFSNSDDAFVCQKKNHFQITCHAQLQGTALFVRTSGGLEKIKSFHLHFYGVKLEAPNQTIRVEQSQSDRSKKPFHPVLIDLQNRQVSKVTVGRLHFSETTSNNMRKKGRPNPEQRYFQLVVGLHAHTHSGHFPVISHGSERIIVRASNPGQFESDVELCWQRGITQDSIYHAGRVGINTDRPDESLVVHGNLKISGHIVQPSDCRAKQEISELDTAQQLVNVQKIRVVKYRYEPEFAIHSGLISDTNGGVNGYDPVVDTGVIAQEVREVLPDAVKETGSILLPNGQLIDNFLVVNKERIFMENIGAVKELCKVTGSLETRIEQLERINSRLVRIQKIDRKDDCVHSHCSGKNDIDDGDTCSNKIIQIIIVVLVVIMAVCLAAISTLYFVEHNTQNERFLSRYEIAKLAANGFNSMNNLDHRWRKNRHEYPILSGPIAPTIGVSRSIGYQDDGGGGGRGTGGNGGGGGGGAGATGGGVGFGAGNFGTAGILPGVTYKQSNAYVNDNNNNNNHNKKSKSIKQPPIDSDLNWTQQRISADSTFLLSDVDSNVIDTLNVAKNENISMIEQSIMKNRKTDSDADLQSLMNISESEDQILFESEYHRERTLESPIGSPQHCHSASDEYNSLHCQSACCVKSSLTVDDVVNESVIPAGDTVIGTGNTGITGTAGNNGVHLQQNVTKKQPGIPGAGGAISTSPVSLPSVPDQVQQTVQQQEQQQQQQSPTTDELKNHKSQLQPQSQSPTHTQIQQQKKTLQDNEPIDVKEPTILITVDNPTKTQDMVGEHDIQCITIQSMIRTDNFNVTIGTDDICNRNGHSFNITYNIPLSRFMIEKQFELVFLTPVPLHWRLCFTKQRMGKEHHPVDVVDQNGMPSDEQVNSGKLFVMQSIFDIRIPNYGYFERQMEFQTTFRTSQLATLISNVQTELQNRRYDETNEHGCTIKLF